MDIVFIETPRFIRKIDRFGAPEYFHRIQDELLENPFKGSVVQGTGGARKVRMQLPGKGKSGSIRVIYYYVDLRGEIWFLDMYAKKEKSTLSKQDKDRLYRFIKEVIHE